MPDKAKVVLTDYVWESLDVENEILGDLADIVAMQTKTPAEFLGEAADCEAVLNTYAGPITKEDMAGMPNCKIIARYGIGVDTIDLDAATEAGIIVTNNPTYCIEEVAEHTMALLLTSARKVAFYDRRVARGRLGGAAGQADVSSRGRHAGSRGVSVTSPAWWPSAQLTFGMRVLFNDPFVEQGQFDAPGEKMEELADMYAQSDFVSIHPPLIPQTRGMMNDEAFAQMKNTAVIVNCSRGPIIDTDALVRALDAGEIAGCALDTTAPEPLPDPHPLRGRENVIINPHAAWYSEESMVGLQQGAPNEVRRVLFGRMARERGQQKGEGQQPRWLVDESDSPARLVSIEAGFRRGGPLCPPGVLADANHRLGWVFCLREQQILQLRQQTGMPSSIMVQTRFSSILI